MTKIMIMSLGGSPEPLTKSIETNRPERVIFLASHDSVPLAGDVLKPLSVKPRHEFEITENPNLMFRCYEAARRCVDRVKKQDVPNEQVMVDYTGGTKVMTAALILATIGEPFHFNYVGGDLRNKDNVGTVIDGHEKMYPEMSPWSIFAEEERRQVITLFNNRQFSSTVKIIDMCNGDLPLKIRHYFDFVRTLSNGFLSWEQFDHKSALKYLNEGTKALETYTNLYNDESLKAFKCQCESCKGFLSRLLAQTHGMTRSHRVLITDLLNNARRCIQDYRHDDAAARIYRALELYGQIIFEEVAGCSNDRVPPEKIPKAVREEFIKKYLNRGDNVLKLPLTATFRFLQVTGHKGGRKFFEQQKKIKDVQSNRNYSILAHGIKPISEKAAESIFQTVADFVGEKEFFDFPTLP
ncbi:MAG: TIGR02710 family CRISPR-associated protein [Deltaproteobacteria bacterium]|nr:TIGR02710 family CRISPR-associated protein [Deltaproteobacteria bacterium]